MKVLFLVTDFQTGGITSSLSNLTHELIKRGHHVAILNLPMSKERPIWMDSKVELLEIKGKTRLWNLSMDAIVKAAWYKKFFLFAVGIVKKLMNRLRIWNKFIFSGFCIKQEYDYAVAFRQEPISIWLVKNKTVAKRKIAFWHSDPDIEDTSSWDHCVYDMDVIAGVSNAVCNSLRNKFPGVLVKTVYNIFEVNRIIEQAKHYDAEYKDTFNIVTVARVDFPPKKLDYIPPIAAWLKEKGKEFCWTIVGDGPDMGKLESLVDQYQVFDCVKLVGAKSNPYPYIKQASLFVLTSAWESYGMVVVEALILNVPVISGDYPALHEILDDGVNGIIVPNSEDGLKEGILRVMTDTNLYQRLKINCNQYLYSSDIAYNQFMSLGEEK